MTREEEEVRLEQAMQRGDELLVNSLRDEERSRQRWRRGLIIGGAWLIILSILLGTAINAANQRRRPAAQIERLPQQVTPVQRTAAPAVQMPEPATTPAATKDWPATLASLSDDNWRRAFAVGGELARMDAEQSWPIVRANWSKVPNFEARQQILKAFAFARLHPRVLDVMHLGMTDPEPQVRAWAVGYLRGLSFQDFAEDSAAYDRWRAKTAGRPAADVVADGATAWVGRLKVAQGDAVRPEARFVREVRNDLVQVPAARDAAVKAGALDVATRWLRDHHEDGDVVAGARDLLTALKPDEGFLKAVILPMLDAKNPPDARRAAVQTLGRADNKWAVDPLVAVLRESVTAKDKERRGMIWDVASALADIGDPRAIPDMIAAIAHDDTYDTVYGVGYFGLSKMTGVRYDETHNGAWWRQWWERERQRFPEPARSSPIPALDKTRAAQSNDNDGDGGARVVRPIFAMILAEKAAVPVEERRANDNERMRYFLMGPKVEKAPKDGYRLLLVLPGGDGSDEFRQFIESVARQAVSNQYLVAQLVAPRWSDAEDRIVWPTQKIRERNAKFTTEAFIDAVVADVAKAHAVDPKHVYALGWSSSGPAVYAAAIRAKTPVTGAFVAMSVFKPGDYPPLTGAKGRPFYILHSPQDFIRMTFPENARKQLTAAGAKVKLETYEGGHGWHGNPHQMIRAGVKWLESQSKPPATTRAATAAPGR